MRPRLAIVLSHPTQYYSPWFRTLSTCDEFDFRVFYLWDFGVTDQRDPKFGKTVRWDVDLLSGYDHEFVPNVARDAGTHHFRGLDNPTLTSRLAAWAPDAILLFGYNWLSHVRAIAWARRKNVPLIFRGDSHFLGRGAPSLSRRLILKVLYRQFAAFLAVGRANADYFTTLGVPRARQFHAPHSVNAAHFDPTLPQYQIAAAALRQELDLQPGRPVVLFAGKFVPEKQPLELLRAFLELRERATLVFVGDGPEKSAMLAAASGAAERIRFLPFANQTEMPARYLLADVFALPSKGWYETWGLAVNEAMHMGTPALVSTLVGCQRDLVTPEDTGWVFEATDATALRTELRKAIAEVGTANRREQLRQAVRARIARYTYSDTTAGLLAALRAVLPTSELSHR